MVSEEKILIYLKDDVKRVHELLSDLKEAEFVYVYLGRLVFPSVRMNEEYLKDIYCVKHGGSVWDGAACVGFLFEAKGRRKIYVLPLGFHRVVDKLKLLIEHFLLKKKSELIRYKVEGDRLNLMKVLVECRFSEEFMKVFRKLNGAGEIIDFLNMVEIEFYHLNEFYGGLSETSFYETSLMLEPYEKEIIKEILKKSVVVNNGEKFLGIVRQILKQEDYLIEESIENKVFRMYSLFHFRNVVPQGIIEEPKKKVWLDLYIYEGTDRSLCRSLEEVFNMLVNMQELYREQLGLVQKIKGKVVLPVFTTSEQKNFIEISLRDAFFMRLFFINQVVLPVLSHVYLGGVEVDVEKVFQFYRQVEELMEGKDPAQEGLSKFLKMRQFLEEVLFFVIGSKVYPGYEVDGTATGRLVMRKPAVFRWYDGVYGVCKGCFNIFRVYQKDDEVCSVCGSSDVVKLDFFSLRVGGNISFDLKSAEVMTFVNFTQDEQMKELISSKDIYCYFASVDLGKDYDELYRAYAEGKKEGVEARKAGKQKVFKLVYGGWHEELPQQFFSAKEWFKECERVQGIYSGVSTLFGRVRFFDNGLSTNERYKIVVNTPIQGTTAELFLLIVFLLKVRLKDKFKVFLINQDGLVGEAENGDDVEKCYEEIKELLRRPYEVLKELASNEKFKKLEVFREDISFEPYQAVFMKKS